MKWDFENHYDQNSSLEFRLLIIRRITAVTGPFRPNCLASLLRTSVYQTQLSFIDEIPSIDDLNKEEN